MRQTHITLSATLALICVGLMNAQTSRDDLLASTFLGHASEFVQESEPVEVLNAYLTLQRHGYLQSLDPSAASTAALLEQWRQLLLASPSSIHALVGLAELEMVRAKSDPSAAADAVSHLIEAEHIGLVYKRVQHSGELADAIVAVGDQATLDL